MDQNKILSILRYLEDQFYNIDCGILQIPEICNFAHHLENSISDISELIKCNNSNANANIDYIDTLQLNKLKTQ